MYNSIDQSHKATKGTFYVEEPQKVNLNKGRLYKIEKVITAKVKGRKKKVLVM